MNASGTDPRAYIKVFWRWKLVFLLCVVALPGGAYLLTAHQRKVYQSAALLQEGGLRVDSELAAGTTGASTSTGNTTTAEILGGEARIIETPSMARIAANHLPRALDNPRALLADIKATPSNTTGFITITVNAHEPTEAADIANAFAQAVVDYRTQQANQLLGAAIVNLEAQLEHLSRRDKVAQTQQVQLSEQLQSYRALKAAQSKTANAQVIQWAVPNTTPVSPKVLRAVLLGLLAGVLLGFGAVFMVEAADRRVRHPEDLEDLTGLPLLSVLPKSAFSPRTATPHTTEAFHMLRSSLMFFNVDRPLSTVLVASPVRGDGKTTVSAGLSVAAAQAGRNVVVIDGDMRRPQVARRLGVEQNEGSPTGLAAVLTGQTALRDALVEVKFTDEDAVGQLRGSLRVLPAGPVPPNPSELIASQRMRDLISELTEFCDLVVVDSTPLLSVSDPLPLLDIVSGTVLVARLNYTSKDAVKRFMKTVSNTAGTVLGVVATGASRGSATYGYGYGYGYGYSAASGNGHRRILPRLPHASRPGARNGRPSASPNGGAPTAESATAGHGTAATADQSAPADERPTATADERPTATADERPTATADEQPAATAAEDAASTGATDGGPSGEQPDAV
jgi:capsular exopolysaccharide synthesis family protein